MTRARAVDPSWRETEVATATVATGERVRRRRRVRPRRVVSATLLVLVCLILLLPVFFMLVSSLKTDAQIGSQPLSLDFTPQWSNYSRTVGQVDYLRDLLNTVFIAVAAVVLNVLAASSVSWVIARNARRWSAWLYRLFVSGLTIPVFALATPLYLLIRDLGLLDNYLSAILIYAALNLPFAVVFYVSFLRSVPVELEDAAAIDGAGPLRTYWSIVLPMARPATATIAIFVTLTIWNDVVVPLLFLSSSGKQTVTLAIYSFVGTQGQVSASELFPAVVLATVPLLVVFVILQRWIVAGVTAGVGKT